MFNYSTNCLTPFIRIVPPCEATPSLQNHIVVPSANTPIISYTAAAAATNTNSGVELLKSTVDAALDQISSDISTFLQTNGFTINPIQQGLNELSSNLGCLNINVANCPTPPVYPNSPFKGIRLKMKAQSGIGSIQANNIWLYSKQAVTGFVFYFVEHQTGQRIVRTVTVDLVAGKNNLLELASVTNQLAYPHANPSTKIIDIFFDTTLSNVCSIPLSVKKSGGCCGKTASYSPNCNVSCLEILPLTGTSIAGVCATTYEMQNDSYGLDVNAFCICDFDSLICNIANAKLAGLKPLMYAKVQQVFAKAVMYSNRHNCFTIMKGKDYGELADDYEREYNRAFNSFITGLKAYISSVDRNCIACTPNYQIRSNV